MQKEITLSLTDELDLITKYEAADLGLSQDELIVICIMLGLKEYLLTLSPQK
ncbi:hypothetical protein [Anaerosinus gibii]|uniref:Uncharacterized protein n=1 Tax=Selenobaculum gibii TaxID=3054208 RepID=A0A9Y2ESL7_9FIRM|nr:hypothetical protein [Selenobaculum gbiensis]WIW70486.1 hypothetical protein P3F81_11465 [Selenobaculum gbiensis]